MLSELDDVESSSLNVLVSEVHVMLLHVNAGHGVMLWSISTSLAVLRLSD
ncbi:hypothetical protein SynA1825c_01321 [Synechococcus sp. A18-25c]|nr:hypothetical protein SynA1825c_01321 [Synechococcus sp. A18-25c]